MSQELKTIIGRKETWTEHNGIGYTKAELHLTRFSGGDAGPMVQLNITPDKYWGDGLQSAHIQLTREEAIELVDNIVNCHPKNKVIYSTLRSSKRKILKFPFKYKYIKQDLVLEISC